MIIFRLKIRYRSGFMAKGERLLFPGLVIGRSIISMNLTGYKFNKAGLGLMVEQWSVHAVYEEGRKGGLMIKRLDPRKDNGA